MYTKQQLINMPTLFQGHDSDIKYETDDLRIWVSRMMEVDGMEEDNHIMYEVLINGAWHEVDVLPHDIDED